MSVLHALEQRAAGQRHQAQASARPARVRFKIRVRGPGEHRLEEDDSLYFRAFFLEEPSVTFGMAIAEESMASAGKTPIGNACVLEWDKNDRGLYMGAGVSLVLFECEPLLEVNFSVVFEGYALRSTAGVADIVVE